MNRSFDRWDIFFVSAVSIAGLALRLHLAMVTYFNPDEAEQALLSFGSWYETLHHSFATLHPPLLTWIAFAVSRISHTELALRLIPILAGTLFPVLLFIWLRKIAGRIAALTVLLLLEFSPNVIALSAQLRNYTPALLFISAALLLFEEAMERGRWTLMAWYSALLWLCIVSDYSTACFLGAAGVYALLRLRGNASSSLRTTWIAGQSVALALYGGLFVFQLRRLHHSGAASGVVNGWLRDGFPQPGHRIWFLFANTPKQFEYLMASGKLGLLAFVLFASAIVLLFTGRARTAQSQGRALAVLLMLPFVLTIAGAYAQVFPYTAGRQTIVLGMFGAIGIGVFVGALPRPAALPLLFFLALLTPLWVRMPDQEELPAFRNRRTQMLECLDYIRAVIPPGAVIFTNRNTLQILAYYEGEHHFPPWQDATRTFSENVVGGRWRVAARDYFYGTPAEYAAALAAFRRQYGLNERDPVWVVDGGWLPVSGPPDEKLPFTTAMRVFQAAAH